MRVLFVLAALFCVVLADHTTKKRKTFGPPRLLHSTNNNGHPRDEDIVIQVGGKGRLERKPTQASLSIRVDTRAEKLTKTKKDHTDTCKKVKAKINHYVNLHHNHNDKIVRESLSIDPIYPRDSRRGDPAAGYRATTIFVVELDEIDETGPLVDAVTELGATLDSIGMDLKEDEKQEAKQDALKQAVENAHKLAEAMAEAANLKVLHVKSITEGGVYARSTLDVREALDEGSRKDSKYSVDPGVVRFQATVTLVVKCA